MPSLPSTMTHKYADRRSPTPSPPASRWSPSSAGEATPPPPQPVFRNSFINSLATGGKRSSRASDKPSSPKVASPPKSFASQFRLKQKPKRKDLRKRGITVVGAHRIGSERYTVMKQTAAAAAALRSPAVGPAVAGRRPSLAAGFGEPSSSAAPPPTLPSPIREEPTPSPTREESTPVADSSSTLRNFVAASPELTFAQPSDELFARRPSQSAMPSVSRLPVGHPANHHARFRAFNDRLASLPMPSPDALSGPAPPLRRPSTVALVVEDEGASHLRSSPKRRLSAFRLSITENRDDAGTSASPGSSRRESIADQWIRVRRPSTTSNPRGGGSRRRSSVAQSMYSSADSNKEESLAPTTPKPTLRRLASQVSFPRSVSYADSAPGANDSTDDFDTPTPKPSSEGEMAWGSYSIRASQPEETRGSIVSEIAPEMMDEFPAPPVLPLAVPSRLADRRALHPTPVVIDASKPYISYGSPSSSPNSIPPSHTSTQSTSSFSSIATDDGKLRLPLKPSAYALSESGKSEHLSNVVRIELANGQSTYKALTEEHLEPTASPPSSRAPTFTMEDLLTPTITLLPPYPQSTLPTEHKFSPVPQPLPPSPSSNTRKPNLRLDFSDFKLQPTSSFTANANVRTPSEVSPMSQPFMAGFFHDPNSGLSDAGDHPMPVIYTPSEVDLNQRSYLDGYSTPHGRNALLPPPGPVTPGDAVENTLREFDFSTRSPGDPFGRAERGYEVEEEEDGEAYEGVEDALGGYFDDVEGEEEGEERPEFEIEELKVEVVLKEKEKEAIASTSTGKKEKRTSKRLSGILSAGGGRRGSVGSAKDVATPRSPSVHSTKSPKIKQMFEAGLEQLSGKTSREKKRRSREVREKEKERRQRDEPLMSLQERRQSLQVGPDVSVHNGGVTRLGNPGKRGFDKVEIRSWLLTARRDSAVELELSRNGGMI
ncbi:hypothetical protein MNV49_001679 [Pseudohyphozyma bogoriensis]|nr:hypothetical protein MNV49_001679 [Pseudohyphozyma bogoriensis]